MAKMTAWRNPVANQALKLGEIRKGPMVVA
jgi:hypothetical protein